MASYCNIGDTARVTFPDGSIRDFTDTPITISCQPQYSECSGATVYFYYSDFNGYTFKENVYGYQRVLLPFYEIRINPNDNSILEAYCRGKFSCVPLGWFTLARRTSGGYFTSVQFDKLVPDEESTENRLTITGYSGAILYDQTVSACDYSVECIEPCPPGTLNCGDCCLPCDEVFNEISAIRKLLKYKK